jgi:hypothetical protein
MGFLPDQRKWGNRTVEEERGVEEGEEGEERI